MPDRMKKLSESCPRILGEDPPAVIAEDDTYRRLLKARIHQGRIFLKKLNEVIEIGNWNPTFFSETFLCMKDMREAALELWSNDRMALVPWLEEFVVTSKYFEEFFRIRVAAGNEPPQNIHAAQRHRLAAEADLWKAKNSHVREESSGPDRRVVT